MVQVDFMDQLSIENHGQPVEEYITRYLINLAEKISKDEHSPVGCLLVMVNLNVSLSHMDGMRNLKPNPIKSLIMANSKDGVNYIKEYSERHDGAIVINKDGQILGASIYLSVTDPSVEIPEGCGTRHIAAASYSLQEDVISVLTLSEETNILRLWKKGKMVKEE